MTSDPIVSFTGRYRFLSNFYPWLGRLLMAVRSEIQLEARK